MVRIGGALAHRENRGVSQQPSPSALMSQYVTFIGDIHGCYHTFLLLLNKLPKEHNRIVLLGDLINKGKRSYEVYLHAKKHNMELLMGNHEYYCIHRKSADLRDDWNLLGGLDTINSIRAKMNIRTEKELEEILDEMSVFFEEKAQPWLEIPTEYGHRILASHAGINKKLFKANYFSVHRALAEPITSVNGYIFNKADLADIPSYIQVIGHRPTDLKKVHTDANYHMDTGCVYNRKGMGWLSSVTFNLTKFDPPRLLHQVNID